MLDPNTLRGFSRELLKLAEVFKTDDLSELKKNLEPGDILYTRPRES